MIYNYISHFTGNSKTPRCYCGRSKKQRECAIKPQSSTDVPGERRSTCPCYTSPLGPPCSGLCKCMNCSNHFNKKKSTAVAVTSTRESLSKKMTTTLKRVSGANFLQANNVSVVPGKWTDLETVTLLVIIEFVQLLSDHESIAEIYNIYNSLADSSITSSFGVVIDKKKMTQISGKLTHIKNKKAVFQTRFLPKNI